MSKLVLYTNPQSRGRIAHWMMEEVGQPYDTVWMEYGQPMKQEPFISLNPMGKVPALQYGDVVVTEAAAICAWLADQFPESKLAPKQGDPARAAYFRWMFFAAGPVEMAVTAKSLNWAVPEGRNMMVGFGSLDDTLHALETALKPGPYLCGEQFTAADVYVGSSLGWGMMFGTIDKRPVFADYVARLYARPAAVRANQINEAYLQKSKKT